MKKLKHFLLAVVIFSLLSILCTSVFAMDENMAPTESVTLIGGEALIYDYATAINDGNISNYILLFTEMNRIQMSDYVSAHGSNDFSFEENVEIKNVSELSAETGMRSAGISPQEASAYDDITIYYVELCIGENQIENKVFVLVKENQDWRIHRISTPDFLTIVEAGEGFNNFSEQLQLQNQENKEKLILSFSAYEQMAQGETVSPQTIPTADPTLVTVYFTKAANRNHYNADRATLDFETYLKNVLPNEWTISWHQYYPAYLQAGTMASKMYAWWYIVHPKWDFYPYYSTLLDDSSDQNFLFSSYSDLPLKMYQNFADDAMNYVRNVAMCDNEGEMFEVHYHTTDGTQYSGQMSATGALSLAKQGYSMFQILSYYYNYSSYIGTDHTILLCCYVN